MRTQPTALFDAPGPRARRRIRIATALTVLGVSALLVAALHRFAEQGELAWERWAPFATWPVWLFLLKGLWFTTLAAAGVVVIAGGAGLLLALGRLAERRPVRWLSASYVEVLRTVPVLLLIYLTLFALPAYGINLPLYWKLVAPLAASGAATFAEVFRAGILSLDRGQREAGLATGLRGAQVTRLIVLPQALRRVVPALVSQVVNQLKNTALGYVVSYYELLFSGKIYANYSDLLIQTFLIVAAIYLVVNASLSKLARVLEKNDKPWGRFRRTRAAALPATSSVTVTATEST